MSLWVIYLGLGPSAPLLSIEFLHREPKVSLLWAGLGHGSWDHQGDSFLLHALYPPAWIHRNCRRRIKRNEHKLFQASACIISANVPLVKASPSQIQCQSERDYKVTWKRVQVLDGMTNWGHLFTTGYNNYGETQSRVRGQKGKEPNWVTFVCRALNSVGERGRWIGRKENSRQGKEKELQRPRN